MARPSKLTDSLTKKLVMQIKAGNYYEPACAYCGIDYSTFRKWMVKGENSTSGKYFEFFHTIKEAEAEAELRVVANWQKAIPDDWRAGEKFLAKRYPQRWGDKQEIDLKSSHTERKELLIEQQIESDPETVELVRQLWRRRQVEQS